MTIRCRPMDAEYAERFYAATVEENARFLKMPPLEFVCLPDPVFLATIRTHPLECLALIDQGDKDEREVGHARIPDDVWAASYSMLLGFNVDGYLDLDKEHRGTYLDVEPEVTRREIAELSSDQLNEYIALMATGVRRRDALAQASQESAA